MAGLNTLNYQKKKIIIRNTANQRLPLSRDTIENIAAKLKISLRGARSLTLGISFLSDKQIRQLNKKYLFATGQQMSCHLTIPARKPRISQSP